MRLWLGLAATSLACVGCGRTTTSLHPEDEEPPDVETAGRGGAPIGGSSASMGGAGPVGGKVEPMGGVSTTGGVAVTTAGAAPVGAPSCTEAELDVTNAAVVDEDADGLYEPGERVRLRAELLARRAAFVARVSAVSDDAAIAYLSGAASDVLDLAPGSPLTVRPPFGIAPDVTPGSEYVLRLTLESTPESPCASKISVERRFTVSNSGEEVTRCDVVRKMVLSDVRTVASGDGLLRPGSNFELEVVLTNAVPTAISAYPGITIVSSHSGVRVRESGEGWRFGLGIGSVALSWGMQVDPSVPSGTDVKLSLYPAMRQVRCLDVAPVAYTLHVE